MVIAMLVSPNSGRCMGSKGGELLVQELHPVPAQCGQVH